MPKSYAIVEDHTLFAQALQLLVSTIPHYTEGKVYADPIDFLEHLNTQHYDVVVVDLNMPKMNGIDLILNIRLKQLPIKILVVSMVNDASVILKALDAGANGFLPKNTQFEELKTALQMIENEQVFIPESMQFAVDNARRLHDMNWEDRNIDQKIVLLSAREREIMQLIAKGYSNTQIGETLFLSPLTIKTHRTNILRKLGLKNSIALALFANSLENKS